MEKLNINKKIFVYKIFNKNYRQIYKGGFQGDNEGMRSEVIEWWKGLGKDLEDDIEMTNE